MPVIIRRALIGLIAGVALTAAACTSPSPKPATATPTSAVQTTPTSIATPARMPSPAATSTASATPVATRTPSGPPSATTPPADYAQSCARDVPWGKQVTKPMLCLDAPAVGARVAHGGRLAVQGYAGGSFENNVVIEVRPLADRTPGAVLVMSPVTYSAPDMGMPGGFQLTLTIPASAPAGPARITAHFDSPKDGSVVISESVDIVIE